jgi:predicted TPR repeat methyltransferase
MNRNKLKQELDQTLNELHQLHRAGEIQLAQQGYLAILQKHPEDVTVLHALGIIAVQQNNFSDAIEYLKKAIKLNANDPVLFLHLANALKLQGLFSQAADVLKQAVEMYPDYFPAINNLGTVYFAQGKLNEAATYFQLAVKQQPTYVDAMYNLGLVFFKQEKLSDAADIYQKILELSPQHLAARFHLACVLMKQEKISAAIEQFLQVETLQANHFETQTNLATCYLKLGKMNEAKEHYLKALELEPVDTQILFNLGVINMQQGHIDSAIQNYQRAVQANPNYFAAHNNLGVAFLAKQHVGYAQHHFQEALRLQPKNPAIQYTVNMLSQHQHLLAAPPDYVKSLFDAYADHYDSHLLEALDYQIPKVFFSALKKILSKNLDILDIGCGTGLCGEIFKPYAKTLTGVDLSEKMLEAAAKKNIYDELKTEELTTFLENKKNCYDLIISGDVFVYIGDLDKIFSEVKNCLRENGLFIFNTEISEKENFKMNQSGRFSHHKKYIEELAKKNQFKILVEEMVTTRLQNNEPVAGFLFVLQAR